MNLVREKVQQLCEARGLKVRELEEKSGCQKNYINGLTSAGTFPSLERIYKICEVLQVSVPEFLEGPHFKDLSITEKEFLETYNSMPNRYKWTFKNFVEVLSLNKTCIRSEDKI